VNGLDYAILALLVLSMLASVLRGAVRELMSLVSWVIAVWLAVRFAAYAATFMPQSLSNPSLRLAAGLAVVFLGALLVLALLTLVVSGLMRKSPLSGADRLLGGVFGFARGIVLLGAATLIVGLTPLPRERIWKEAKLTPALESLALAVRGYLPRAVGERIRYD
jgi:membrane protein required for colicin V production